MPNEFKSFHDGLVQAGAGNDIIHLDDAQFNVFGGTGFDTVHTKVDYFPQRDIEKIVGVGTASIFINLQGRDEPGDITGNAGPTRFSPASATIPFAAGRVTTNIHGARGSDNLFGDAGNDTIYGDAGTGRERTGSMRRSAWARTPSPTFNFSSIRSSAPRAHRSP